MTVEHSLPPVPVPHADFIKYIQSRPRTEIPDLVRPYNEYDAVVRKIFAQEPNHPATADNLLNIVPVFGDNGHTDLKIRARDIASESEETKSKYLLPLKDDLRKPSDAPAVVSTLKQFQTNFNIFSESSLSDLDWSNVVAAGSAVATSLLPVPAEFTDSKRGLRQFYHEKFAPASDVDLFLYGLTEKQAVEKIKQIERCIKDSILTETSTIRTKHAITIVSQYPTRHVQIVLRLYKSIAEILTGFDVDCSCAAYDGQQVYLAPRAVGAYITQTNHVDLSRRSPSYENRLSKYSHRGFEIFWPDLDRSQIDPTIFERSFARTVGLARLLVLERLPKSSDREAYLEQRRKERGRPSNDSYRYSKKLRGNIKNDWDDEVAEWVEEDEVSNYHTFTIPYGERFHARKIEKLLYTQDLLLNAEWNKPKDREVNLHRHPAFFGNAEDVIHDCCGSCPKPVSPEEQEIAEEEGKRYVSGKITFLQDNPGRQEIGSFNPITETDWTEMAYVGNTEGLCQAIVDNDLEAVQHWLTQGIDINRRDHTGRTPLHLAVMTSSPEIVQHLVNNGARLIARIADGRTALHLAAARGSVQIIRVLLTKSAENEEEEARKEDARKGALAKKKAQEELPDAEDDGELISNPSDDDDGSDGRSNATGSFVKVKKDDQKPEEASMVPDDQNDLDPDIYDVNVLAWDTHASPLHLAILKGHVEAVDELVTSFGADLLLPIKLLNSYDNSPRAAILTLVLALRLPLEKAKMMTAKLLQLGASPAQADVDHRTSVHYLAHSKYHEILDVYMENARPAVERALNYLSLTGSYYNFSAGTALTLAIQAKDPIMAIRLLEVGAKPDIGFEDFLKSGHELDLLRNNTAEHNKRLFEKNVDQPIILAVDNDQPSIAIDLLARGADPNTLTNEGYMMLEDNSFYRHNKTGSSMLDYVRAKLGALREYQGEKMYSTESRPLDPDDGFYLQCFESGTYKYWTAKNLLDQERKKVDEQKKRHQQQVESAAKRAGLAEKRAAIQVSIRDYEQLEADLLSKGAKTFGEMYPDINEASGNDIPSYTKSEQAQFTITFQFQGYDITDDRRQDCLQLFEAAWCGDIERIKELTLGMWGVDKDLRPLEIGTVDSRGYSPFTIAVLRGHLEVARAIIAIAVAQYKPANNNNDTRYRIQEDGEDDEGSCVSEEDTGSDSGSIQLETHNINDQFTIENVGEIKTEVESKISPKRVLEGNCNISLYLEPEKRPKQDLYSLIEFAIWKDDTDLLIFLIELGQQLTAKYADESNSAIYTVSTSQFLTAMRLGRLRCLEELIKRTGAGLPLDKLAENCGVEIKEKPKYYQGLSVYGKKRADWAAAGGGMPVVRAVDMHPPLLLAAKEGSLEAVEWFLGTAPGRYYIEFAKANKDDKRLQRLALSDKGLEQSITDWLGSRRDLVLHCAVLSEAGDESVRLVEYLVQNLPHTLEVKSVDGYTPLAVAFSREKLEFAKILVDAKANQTVRDKEGRNLLHFLFGNLPEGDDEKLKKIRGMLKLIDPLLVPSMLLERCSSDPGSLTPLASWISKSFNYNSAEVGQGEQRLSVLELILDFAEGTGQKHLEVFDGAGNTPVHVVVRYRLDKVLKILLARRPDLLYRENASGSTPAELAEVAWISTVTSDPPSVGTSSGYSHSRTRNLRACAADDPPEKFTKEYIETARNEKSPSDRMYTLCREKGEELRGVKRKLVTLFDANEVAKRLASRKVAFYSSRRYLGRQDNDTKKTDEVGEWL